MKLAITGKGGVGKTTLAALLAKAFSQAGHKVLAIDADPDANLAATLGFPHPETIIPIAEMKEMIAERTGAGPGGMGLYFKLNPKVDDLPDRYCVELDGIKLMVMGTVKKGGSGCVCPENVLLRALLQHLLVARDEVVIMDMEAGIEHLGRGTARAVDKLIVVVEPGRKSVDTAYRIRELAGDIGLKNIAIVGNKMQDEGDKVFLLTSLKGFDFLGFLSYDRGVVEADLARKPPFESSPQALREVEQMALKLKEEIEGG